MIKILHCADIHLDSPFAGGNIQLSEQRRQELRSSFINMMMYVRDNKVNLLLVSGDLFDSNSPAPDTVAMVIREFAAAVDTKIIISPGNHDFYFAGSVYEKYEFPKNVHILKKDAMERVDIDALGVSVFGYAFTSRVMFNSPFAAMPDMDNERINIIVAHGELGNSSSDNCPISLTEIRDSGADYVALGHLHTGSEVLTEGKVRYAYSGSLEGRDFGERGERGALIAAMAKSGDIFDMQSKFVRFSKRRYETMKLDVTGVATDEELLAKFDTAVRDAKYGDDTLLRVTIVGEAVTGLNVSEKTLASVADKLFYMELTDQSVPQVDISSLEHDPTIKGAFYEALLPAFRGTDTAQRDIAEMALRYGLAALDGNDIIDF
ncbi:MAG: DNA repair exonuclease [Oscillospiraceae bacterium]|nr:DNA repair exonuclease [Oscillospiraceae bacterium]